jgi:hypothetical protein
VTGQTVYTDFDRDQYVSVETRLRRSWTDVRAVHDRIFEESFGQGPPIASEMGVRFRKRLVFGFPALREKLMIWDAGLDDVVVESLKADLGAGMGAGPGDVLLRLEAVLSGGHLTFLVFEPDRQKPIVNALQRGTLAPPVGAETVLASTYRERLESRAAITRSLPWLGDDWLVDLHDGWRTFAPTAG